RDLQYGKVIAPTQAEVMKMKKGLLVLAAILMALAPVSAPAAVRGFVMVGPSYYGGYYRPYWGPMYGGYYATPYSGEVKLDTEVKEAGRTRYAEKIYVVAGKTLHLQPEL